MGVLTSVSSAHPGVYPSMINSKTNDRELSRLITAAVVNRGFCQMLLENPQRALASGYKGETFSLGSEEQDLISSIRAGTLAEFASQLVNQRKWSAHNNGNGHRGRM
jgi:hypothetical protein